MAKTKVVKLQDFSRVMAETVSQVCGEACEEAVDVLQEVSEEALRDVETTAPISSSMKGTGGHHLRDAFRLDALVYANKGTASQYNFGVPAQFVIHAPKWHKYSIIHLLELGHRVSGRDLSKSFVQGRPFMVPAEDRAKQKIIARLRERGLAPK